MPWSDLDFALAWAPTGVAFEADTDTVQSDKPHTATQGTGDGQATEVHTGTTQTQAAGTDDTQASQADAKEEEEQVEPQTDVPTEDDGDVEEVDGEQPE